MTCSSRLEAAARMPQPRGSASKSALPRAIEVQANYLTLWRLRAIQPAGDDCKEEHILCRLRAMQYGNHGSPSTEWDEHLRGHPNMCIETVTWEVTVGLLGSSHVCSAFGTHTLRAA